MRFAIEKHELLVKEINTCIHNFTSK